MIYFLIVITSLFFISICRYKIGTLNNPISYYLTFWLMWITVSIFNPFNLYPVSNNTYLIIWLNLFFFSLGYFLVCGPILDRPYQIFKISMNK